MLLSGLEKLLQFAGAKGPARVSSTFGLIFSSGVMLLAMPMLFTTRTRVAAALIEALPVPDADAKRIVDELILMTRSMFSSVVLTAAVQA